MTKHEIKECYAAGNSAWEILAMLINDGVEYPDAEYRVIDALQMNHNEVQEMVYNYNNYC